VKVPASFLLVRVRLRRWKFGLYFPLPLFVLEDTAEAGALLASAGVRLSRWLGRRSVEPPGRNAWPVRLALGGRPEEWERAVYMPLAVVRALRACGRVTIADVQAGDADVTVQLV